MDLLSKKLDAAAEAEFAFCAGVIARYFFRDISFEHSALVSGVPLSELHERLRFFMKTCAGAVRFGSMPVDLPVADSPLDAALKAIAKTKSKRRASS